MRRVQSALAGLYPRRHPEEVLGEYGSRKKRYILLILLVGGSLTAGVWCKEIWEESRASIRKDGVICRSEPGEGGGRRSLIAEMGHEKIGLEMDVAERLLEREEAEALEEQFWKEVESLLPGGNPSLEEVWKPLNLPEELDGYPFWVEWRSLTPEIVSSLGNVAENAEGNGTICARVHYEDLSWDHRVDLRVRSPSGSSEEQRRMKLVQLLEAEEERTRYESVFRLPEKMEGETIIWKSPGQNRAGMLLLLTGVLAVAVSWGMDQDLDKNWKICRQAMVKEYPMIVSKLTLYLGAGMTIRGSMQRLTEGKTTPKTAFPNIYDLIQHACQEINMGVAEKTAYENMGRRTGTCEYVRLAGILNQSLTRGGGSLLKRLEEEARASMKSSLEQRKKEGEEATTKLLVPMVMMLGIVMVLVIIPAFGSIG